MLKNHGEIILPPLRPSGYSSPWIFYHLEERVLVVILHLRFQSFTVKSAHILSERSMKNNIASTAQEYEINAWQSHCSKVIVCFIQTRSFHVSAHVTQFNVFAIRLYRLLPRRRNHTRRHGVLYYFWQGWIKGGR